MKLLTKFNLILLVVFGAGGLILSQVAYAALIANARREVLQEAELMMASARAVRDYTSSELAPLLEQNPEHKTRFLAETVPSFRSHQYIHQAAAEVSRLHLPRSHAESDQSPASCRRLGDRCHWLSERSPLSRRRLPESGRHRPDLRCTWRRQSRPIRRAWSVTAVPLWLLRP
jgi:hypothetical protein